MIGLISVRDIISMLFGIDPSLHTIFDLHFQQACRSICTLHLIYYPIFWGDELLENVFLVIFGYITGYHII